jgi:DNA polymerase-3 subunit alpha
VEWLGLLTLDLLGLRALSLTGAIQARIEQASGEKLDLAQIELDEPDVFELITTGDTDGVFHFESERMRRTARVVRPDRFEDLAALIAMNRPHAADLPSYGRGKRDPESVDYATAELTRTFSLTYGVPLYQEQVMATLVELGGFTASEANQARRALGKKQRERILRWRDRFFAGAAAHNIAPVTAEHIWRHYIEEATDWAFNKAHAVAYALIAYRLAWLKARYPLEFLTALESSRDDW